jgi:5-methylcytosine-specific restriction endonuclease McrA
MKAMRLEACHYCGVAPAGTIDHKTPISKGGLTNPENCVPACGPCNSYRKSRPYEWFKTQGWKQRQFAGE